MSKKFMRITVDNGTPQGEVHTFPLEKVRSIEVVERLWDRIQNYIFGTDPTLESLTSVQKSMDDFVQSSSDDDTKSDIIEEAEWDPNQDWNELLPEKVKPVGRTLGTRNHCGTCGTKGRRRQNGSDYCKECAPDAPIEAIVEPKESNKDHTPLSAEERATFAQRRLALVGTDATFPDGSVWRVIEHIVGSQYKVQREILTKSTNGGLGTRRNITKFASHSTKSGWKDWEVRF